MPRTVDLRMTWLRLARVVYWAMLAGVFAAAIAPLPVGVGEPSDKVEHFAAFYVLQLGAAILFPRRGLWLGPLLLAAYGGLIEIVQGLPLVGRDRDLNDWIVDLAGVACAAVPFAVSGLRARMGDDKSIG